jgi:hypothetical protein
MTPKFNLGRVVATPGALAALEDSGQTPAFFLDQHIQGDWGDICDEDRTLNDAALVDGSRLLSVYTTLKGVRLYVISEAMNNEGNRTLTTILRTDEY